MAYTRMKAGAFLAVVEENDWMLEVTAKTKEEAREIAKEAYGKANGREPVMSVCKIPEMLNYC